MVLSSGGFCVYMLGSTKVTRLIERYKCHPLEMIKAYVLITSEKGFSKKTTENLVRIPGVKTADALYGVYDICVCVEARNMGQLEKTVISRIRKVEDVANTLTLIVAWTTSRR